MSPCYYNIYYFIFPNISFDNITLSVLIYVINPYSYNVYAYYIVILIGNFKNVDASYYKVEVV